MFGTARRKSDFDLTFYQAAHDLIVERWPTEPWPQVLLICGNHEPFNRLTLNESIHNRRDVGDRHASVEKVIGFD
jgi:hypothetical protein